MTTRMANCLFCRIGAHKLPSELIYEDPHAFAFLDIHPKAPGHAMVVPKIHAETIIDLPNVEIGPLFEAVQKVTKQVKSALHPHGFTIGLNHGRKAGQVIDHLHVHIIPRFAGDKGGSLHAVVDNPPREPLPEIAKKIRNA